MNEIKMLYIVGRALRENQLELSARKAAMRSATHGSN